MKGFALVFPLISNIKGERQEAGPIKPQKLYDGNSLLFKKHMTLNLYLIISQYYG